MTENQKCGHVFMGYRNGVSEAASGGVIYKRFAKFTWKKLCWSLFSNRVAGLPAYNLIKKETSAQVFSVSFAKFLRASFFN